MIDLNTYRNQKEDTVNNGYDFWWICGIMKTTLTNSVKKKSVFLALFKFCMDMDVFLLLILANALFMRVCTNIYAFVCCKNSFVIYRLRHNLFVHKKTVGGNFANGNVKGRIWDTGSETPTLATKTVCQATIAHRGFCC